MFLTKLCYVLHIIVRNSHYNCKKCNISYTMYNSAMKLKWLYLPNFLQHRRLIGLHFHGLTEIICYTETLKWLTNE